MELFEKLPEALLPWYDENKRDLPWRRDCTAYHVWLSEIMLQQTRVEAVKGYYARFLKELPTIGDLANCDDERLHKLWEGLGYYTRVRNLKKAARMIVENYGGQFPTKYEDVLALPGIGEYTAGAICSIAFEQPVPAVDGNVLRVAARLMNDTTPVDRPEFKMLVRRLLQTMYPKRAGDFTQALMELGATLCGPNGAPQCSACPCSQFCRGYAAGTAEKLPVKLPKKTKKVEEMTVFLLSCDGRYALQKRPNTGLLATLWQFPNVAGMRDTVEALMAVEAMGLRPKQLYRLVRRHHIFTHIRWEMQGVYLEVQEPAGDFVWMSAAEIESSVALPTAFRQFWEEMDYV